MIWRRTWSHILIGIVSLFLLLQVFLRIWLNPIAERVVSQSLPLLTDGIYRVDSMDIYIRPLSRTVNIRNFSVSIDSINRPDLTELTQSPHLVRLNVEEISIRKLDLTRLLFKKEFDLRLLHFKNPFLHLRIPNLSVEKTASGGVVERERNPDLFPLISPVINGIYMNSFEWESGQLLIDQLGAKLTKPIQAKEITLSISHIEIDSTSYERSGRPLYSDKLAFKLDIADYTVVLPDSQYQIQAGEVYYANEFSTLQIDSLSLFPYEGREGQDLAPLSIEIPQVLLQGIQPGEILFDRYLGLDSLTIYEAQVDIFPNSQPGSGKSFLSQNPNDLFPLVSDALDDIHLDYLGLLGAGINVKGSPSDSVANLSLGDLDLHLHNITIDSTTHLQKDVLFCTEEIELDIDTFALLLEKHDLLIAGGETSYHTGDEIFRIEEITATPRNRRAPQILSGRIPKIQVEGLSLPEIWIEKQLDLSAVFIERPQLEYADFPNRRQQNLDAIASARPDTLLKQVLQGVNVELLAITEGSFLLNDHQRSPKNALKAQNISLEVESFQLEDLENKELGRLFYADQVKMEFEVEDYYFLLPDSSYEIRFPHLWISSSDSVLIADSLTVYPRDNGKIVSQTYMIEIPQLKIQGWDPYELYFYRKLHLDSIFIESPFIRRKLYQSASKGALPALVDLDLYPFIQKQLDSLKVDYFSLRQGQLEAIDLQKSLPDTLFAPLLGLQIFDFQLDESSEMNSDNVFYTSDIQLELAPYSLLLPDQKQELSWNRINFSTQAQQITLSEIVLETVDSSSVPALSVSIPQVAIQGTDLYDILKEKEIFLDKIRCKHPTVSIPFELQLPDAQEDSLPPIDLFPLIEPFVHVFAIDSFIVEQGTVNLVNPSDVEEKLQISDITFEVSSFLLDSLAKARSSKPFYADHIDLQADIPPYSIILPDSSYRIEFRDIDLSTSDSTFSIDSLRLEPLAGSREDALAVDLLLDKLELKGIDLTELYFDQILSLSNLRLSRPRIHLVINKNSEDEEKSQRGFDQRAFITEDPYPQLSEVFDYVDIEEVELEEGRIVLSGQDIRPFGIRNFSIRAENFRLDSLAYELLDHTYLFSEDLTLVLRDFEVPLSDSAMYTLELGELGLSTANRYLYANNVNLIPKYGRYEFGQVKNEVVDRWSLSNRRLELRGLDIPLLLRKQAIRAGELRLRDTELEIFKDKRYPFPYKRPKMPWEELRDLSTYLHLDSITVRNAYVFYEERNVDTDTTAWFKLSELDASLSPVSNDTFLLLQNPEMFLHTSAIIMDTALLDMRINIPLTDTSNYHTVEGDVYELPAISLNPIIERTASIRAMDGDIHSVFFRFRADNQISRGKMKMRYNDLKVNLLNPKPQKKRGLGRLFGSALANTFVVHSDNPKRFLRVGRIEFEREINKGFIVYWIKSIVDGIKSSVGISKKEEKELE